MIDHADEEDDLPLRGRAHAVTSDREITLGTTMILLIFFALAVYGAALFGFGYSLGSKRSAGTPAPLAVSGAGLSASNMKPSPASLAGSAAAKPAAAGPTVVPYTPPSGNDAPVPVTKPDTVAAETPRALPSAPVAAIAAAADAPAPPGSGPAIVVQVAAVSHQEDAQMIASTLEHRGYTVNVRSEPDKLFHVQIGPFYARKDADAMKARLLADGFNAYIK